jgi:hypothetical protein
VVDASQMHTVPMKWCCARARIATSRTEHLPIKDGRAIYRCCYVRVGCVTTKSVCVLFVVRCVGSAMHQHYGVAPHHHACSRAWIAWHVDGVLCIRIGGCACRLGTCEAHVALSLRV